MGIFDRLKNLFRADKGEEYVYSAKELSSNSVKESKKFIPFGSLLKDKSGMLLKKGDRIVGKGIDSYTLYIPGYNSSRLQKFYEEAKKFVGNTTGEERVQKLMQFVHDNIEHEVGWERQTITEQQKHSGIIEKEVSLIRSIFLGKGVCKEQAAVLSMMLRMEGLENEFIRGKPEITSPLFGSLPMEERGGRHAWIKVKVGNDYYYVDPTNECFEKYDSGLLKYKLHEDSGYYPRSDGTLIKRNDSRFVPFGSLLKDKSGTFPRVGKIPKLNLFERLKNFFWPSKGDKTAKEITTEQEALQELTDKLAFELSDWWGIPRDKIKGRIPKIETISSDEMYFMTGSGRNLGLYSFEKNKIFLNSYVASEKHLAIYPEQDEKYTLYSVKGVIGEEVGHFIENFVKTDLNINLNDVDVSEFFGLTSSLFIAEKIPQLFKEEYRRCLLEAANFSKEKKNLEIQLADLEKQKMEAEQPKKPVLGIKPGTNYTSSLAKFASKETIKNQIKECQTQIEHLSYYPAVAYYYEMRKMTPQERYKLITMQQAQIKSEIIKPISDRLTEIVNSILAEDNLLRLERERLLMPETNTKQVAEEVSEPEIEELEEHEGQPPEEYPEAEQNLEEQTQGESEQPLQEQEVQEEEQTEEAQEEQYAPESEQAPQQPKINISIPDKVTKKVAKKLESMGIKLPKKMIKN